MRRADLIREIKTKQSYLCIGLDSDIGKIPQHLVNAYDDPLNEFNSRIIEATKDYCVAYKANIAFYEKQGKDSLDNLSYLMRELPYELFTIADAKRGDIGNTSKMYAEAFLRDQEWDAITVSPYMGMDSVTPFLQYDNKWAIILALTSNKGADDFRKTEIINAAGEKRMLFEEVLSVSQHWGSKENIMYVIGATQAELMKRVRSIVPDHFLLVPGIGAQGGSLEEVSKYGMNKDCGLLVNSSRQIIYASSGEDFAEKARAEAKKIQRGMQRYLEMYMH